MKAKPIGRAQCVDHVSLAQVDLLRADALLSYLAYTLKYADSEKSMPSAAACWRRWARQQVASVVDRLDASGTAVCFHHHRAENRLTSKTRRTAKIARI